MQARLKSVKLLDDFAISRVALTSDDKDPTQVEIELRVKMPRDTLKQRSVDETDVLVLDCVRKAIAAFAMGRSFEWG